MCKCAGVNIHTHEHSISTIYSLLPAFLSLELNVHRAFVLKSTHYRLCYACRIYDIQYSTRSNYRRFRQAPHTIELAVIKFVRIDNVPQMQIYKYYIRKKKMLNNLCCLLYFIIQIVVFRLPCSSQQTNGERKIQFFRLYCTVRTIVCFFFVQDLSSHINKYVARAIKPKRNGTK